MLRIPWSTDIGLAYSQICVTLISLIAWSRSPTISAAKRLGGQRSQGISLPSWKLSHLFYIGALAFISSETHGPVRSLMVGAGGTNARGRVRSSVPVHVIPLATILNFPHKLTLSLFLFLSRTLSLSSPKSSAPSWKCGGCVFSFSFFFMVSQITHREIFGTRVKQLDYISGPFHGPPNLCVIRLHFIVRFLFALRHK